MRSVALTTGEGGMNRLRIKGGATPNVLYDLLNGYVNENGAPTSRPGTVSEIALPAGTKGLCAHNGELHVFSHLTDLVTGNAKYVVDVLVDPASPTSPIARIEFAAPYLGSIYVVATFESGNTYHYWLQDGTTWAPKTMHQVGDVVVPTVPNGFAYRAHRLGDPYPLWSADAPRTILDRVEPTTPNGWGFEVTATIGDSPRSGDTEPTWNIGGGAITVEDVDLGAIVNPPASGGTTPGGDTGTGPSPAPGPIRDRYDTEFGQVSP